MRYDGGSSTLETGAVTSTVNHHRLTCFESSLYTNPSSVVVGYQTAISAIRHGEESFGEGGDGATETKAQAESDENAPSNASTTPKSEPVLKGEQIYALQYRKVVFKPLFSMDVRIASLQQRTRWRVIWKE